MTHSEIRNPQSAMTETVLLPEYDGQKIEVAPGKKTVPVPAGVRPPKIGLFKWELCGPGQYRPVIAIHETWVRVTQDTPQQLGMGISYDVLMRLIRAGFVDGRKAGANSTQFNLESWYAHLEATKDPEFWDPRGPNMKKWREAFR